MTLTDILRSIDKNTKLYIKRDTTDVGDILYFLEQLRGHRLPDENIRIPRFEELSLVELPSYKDINHKDIMSFYVKECIEDKSIRKRLFNILRKHDYMDDFITTCKELNLYEEYITVTDSIYTSIAKEWILENKLDYLLEKKN